MTSISIDIDASDALAMFDQLEAAAENLSRTLEREAEAAVGTISGIPVRTGRLAASPRVGTVTEASATIISDVEYARYVFRGTTHMAARPPQVGYSVDQLADELAASIFQER